MQVVDKKYPSVRRICHCNIMAVVLAILCSLQAVAQTPDDETAGKISVFDIPDKVFNSIDKSYEALNKRMDRNLTKMLTKMQKQEAKLQKQLAKKDSTAAAKLFDKTQQQYEDLQQKLKSASSQSLPIKGSRRMPYIPRLDSLQTATKFLEQSGILNNSKLNEVKQLSGELQNIGSKLQAAEQIQTFIKERKQQLAKAFGAGSMVQGAKGMLTKYKKEAYYYQQQMNEYKTILNDTKKMEEKALSVLRELPAFQNFMKKNSYLAQLFGAPSGSAEVGATGAGTSSLAGLQTRASVEALLQQRFGASGMPSVSSSGGGTSGNPLEQGMQQAREQLNAMKDKLNKLGGVSSDLDMPDFKPNKQKTKTFLQRLEPSFDIQTQRSNGIIPSVSDIGLSLGYKLNDKSVAGVGASYKLGWGQPIKNIHFSSEGLSLRTFIDWKAPFGNSKRLLLQKLWFSGGAEMNYMQSFKNWQELNSNVNVWQRSALMGLSYKAGKVKTQLLYDFLWNQQIPRSGSALKFRVGYVLK